MSSIIFERFADYILKKEKSKKNFVHKIINQGDYEAKKDYYLQLRIKLINLLKKNKSLEELDELISVVSSKKTNNYRVLIENIQSFLKGRNYKWIDPQKGEINYSGLTVNVNPEIGLLIDGTTYYIKIYFKQQEISIKKVCILEKIMQDFCKEENNNVKLAVWDIKRCKMHFKDSQEIINIDYDLNKEALNWLRYAAEE